MTVVGNKLPYNGGSSSPAVSLLNTKIMINSVILDVHKEDKVYDCRHKKSLSPKFYENIPYMQIPLKYLTQKFQDEHNVNKYDNGYIYVEIRKFMYRLKEAGILFFNYVVKS